MKFIEQLAAYQSIPAITLYNRFCSFLKEKHQESDSTISEHIASTGLNILTPEQQEVYDSIVPALINPYFQPFVIHGVTGCGKTEVYHHLIEKNCSLNKSTVLLLPEVSLAVKFTELFKARCTSWPVYGFHSGTSITEKKALWNHIQNNKPALIIGVHLPILLPLSNCGLIIIDEEHEVGYQEKKYPKINTKEAALMRAQITNIPIVLGSATPSISTLYNVKHRNWKMFTIKKRFAGAFPKIKVVLLSKKEKRGHFWITKDLEAAMTDRLNKKEQSLIFLNRRGFSFFVQCASCGFIFRCTSCSVSFTLHEGSRTTHEPEYLCCHYCGHQEPLPATCSSCSNTELIKKGIGTQQVVSILQRIFPQARIGRADQDATVNRKKWQQTLKAFYDNALDILVGTQTITKGYHFPNVTLVGVLWADINLSIPTYNAAEITLQQLIQVAGRAGRQNPDSLVIVQTMLKHPILDFISEVTYPSFYESEIKLRSEVKYPPLVRFAEIELRHQSEEVIEKESDLCATAMDDFNRKHNLGIILLGPAQPPVHKIKNVHIRKIYLKGSTVKELLMLYKSLHALKLESSLFFTPNPLSM
jgi:primosomal protein N' (replication factor Y)